MPVQGLLVFSQPELVCTGINRVVDHMQDMHVGQLPPLERVAVVAGAVLFREKDILLA